MTALLLVVVPLLALASAAPEGMQVTESVPLDNGLNRGEWGPVELCPADSYVFSFEIKYAPVGHIDDTCVNAIRMYCQSPVGTLTKVISSSEGTWGEWLGMRTCPKSNFLTAVRANVVPEQGPIGDDLGLDNLQMRCSSGDVLDGRVMNSTVPAKQDPVLSRQMTQVEGREVEAVHLEIEQPGNTKNYGDWGLWGSCSPGKKICGLEVRLEDNHPLDDDAGVTDLVVYCCSG